MPLRLVSCMLLTSIFTCHHSVSLQSFILEYHATGLSTLHADELEENGDLSSLGPSILSPQQYTHRMPCKTTTSCRSNVG